MQIRERYDFHPGGVVITGIDVHTGQQVYQFFRVLSFVFPN